MTRDSNRTTETMTRVDNKVLMELKERLADLHKDEYDDRFYMKWLKARQYDASKSEKMFRESAALRERLGVSRLRTEYKPPPVVRDYLSGGFHGYDKEGLPVRYELFGRLDMRGLMHAARKSDLVKSKLLVCETVLHLCEQQSIKLNRMVDGLVVIFDMSDVTMHALWKPGLQMYLYLVQLLEDNYPEMLRRMFIINAPSYFHLFWFICKPLVSADMRRKFIFCGHNYLDTLLQYIDADQILTRFRGETSHEADEASAKTKQICLGGTVPTELYINRDALKQRLTFQLIPAGKSFTHYVTIGSDQIDFILRWEYLTESYDIDFEVRYRNRSLTEADDDDVIYPRMRVQSQRFIEDGYVVCNTAGTYSLIFDNSRSWRNPKRLYFRTYVDVTLRAPEND